MDDERPTPPELTADMLDDLIAALVQVLVTPGVRYSHRAENALREALKHVDELWPAATARHDWEITPAKERL